MSIQNIIELKQISFKYNKKQTFYNLNNINFSVKKNSFHAFIGSNGAGKSTTINILIGNTNDYEGELLINGLNPKNDYRARNSISYFTDKPIFPSDLSIEKYLYIVGMLVNDNKEILKNEISNLLKRFGLYDFRKRNGNRLSAGQKQKVLLIKTMIEKAELIILDEPASNLDPTARIEMYSVLKDLQEKNGSTIIISSHNLDEISRYADSATFIKKGEILYSGETHENLLDIYQKEYLGQE